MTSRGQDAPPETGFSVSSPGRSYRLLVLHALLSSASAQDQQIWLALSPAANEAAAFSLLLEGLVGGGICPQGIVSA